MDTTHFTIVAGQAAHDFWSADMNAGLAEGKDLCQVQEEQASRGLMVVEVCPSLYGWSVRYASGLQGFDLLASCRRGQVDGTRTDAIRYATEWVAKSPTYRYAFLRKAHENADERHPLR